MARFARSIALVALAACTPKPSAKRDPAPIVDAGDHPDASAPDAEAPLITDAGPPVIVARKKTSVKAWLQGQGVSVKSLGPLATVDECVMAGVGNPSEAALLCESHLEVDRGPMSNSAYRIVFRRIVVVVRNGAIVTLLDVAQQVRILDPEDGAGELLELTLDLAVDGLSATVVDDPKTSCKAAIGNLKTENDLPMWKALDSDLFAKACAARGHYTWKSGVFVKDP